MSYSSDVKKELSTIENNPCCDIAQSYGLLLFGRAFSRSEISILTENSDVAAAYAKAVSILSGTSPDISISDAGNFSVNVTDRDVISRILTSLGSAEGTLKRRINFTVLNNDRCSSAFIRGAFLACGTVTDPEKEYHLEFSSSSRALCDDLIKLFDETDIEPKCTQRGGSYVVYIKKSSEIEDALSFMGATECSMSLMGAKMYKDIRNTVNRRINFESANMMRCADAAAKQYEAICYIRDNAGLDVLSEDLLMTAKMRLGYPEASSAEIARRLPVKISVSGVNHRFKRLIDTAQKLRDRKKKTED